ncbi:LacI family DNA-binding transcriptional regulator [Jiangella muralis]|uniref:LacI family DNA-binding transcriptional regulator n=1 Tax=Jiangella muralis TaxID=702383 RepID=UPI00146FC90A|nr:LacI family DNA-binding transcriptional regulator [Jiangella muralis]
MRTGSQNKKAGSAMVVVRQIDVARVAGVSQTTVSMVLNERTGGSARISEDTRERVLSAIKKTGYVANPIAQSLAGHRTGMFGVFAFEPMFTAEAGGFYTEFLGGIEAAGEAARKDLLLFTSTVLDEPDNHIYRRNENRLRLTDGAILLGNGEPKMELARLHEDGFPFVYIGRREIPNGEISYVSADYAAATADLVERLVAVGHERLCYVGTGADASASIDRRRAFVDTLRDAGLPVDRPVPAGHGDYAAVRQAVEAGATALLVEPPVGIDELTAVIERAGYRVPADVSVALLGDVHGHSVRPDDWSGYRLPRWEMGMQAVKLLVRLMEDPGGPARRVVVPCLPHDGCTVAPAPRPGRDRR